MEATTGQLATICVFALLALAIVVGLPVGCTIDQQRQNTVRIQAACSGADAARSPGCALALANAEQVEGHK